MDVNVMKKYFKHVKLIKLNDAYDLHNAADEPNTKFVNTYTK